MITKLHAWHPPILDDTLAGPFVWHLTVDALTFPARWVLRTLADAK